MKAFRLFLPVSLALLIGGCARNPVTGKKQVVLMSTEQEIAMGQEADPQVIAQFGLYEDSAIQRYIQQKGSQLAAVSHRPNLDWRFRVVNSEVINAFAVPGGYVYFTRGILAHFNNEAQLLGVLGHEIGHVAARHSVIQQRNQVLGQIGLIAGMVLSPELARFGETASQGLGLLFLKFGRDDERESDKLGVEYSTKLGYDARQMANFFNVLKRQNQSAGSSELPPFLSTHPDPGERNTTVNQLAVEEQRKQNLTNPQVNREAYLRLIDGMVYGEDPREGYRENNVFYHPVLRFQWSLPTNWNYQNTPQQVQLAAPDGKALMILTSGAAKTAQEAASAFSQQYNLRVVESQQTTVNGLRALALVGDPQPQQGQQASANPVRVLAYFIEYENSVYLLMGVSTVADFNSYSSVFNNSIQSFRALTDAAKLNKKPTRVRIRTVQNAGTVSQVLRSYGVPDNRLEEVALLNEMSLTDTVRSGTLIKVLGE